MSTAASQATPLLVPWLRFWRPLGEPLPQGFEDDGFLADPTEIWNRSATSELVKLPELAQQNPVLVLWGEPGIGKSKELELHRRSISPLMEKDDAEVWLTLRGLQDFSEFVRRTAGTEEWARWKAGSGYLTLVIDGVDEGFFRIPDFIGALTTFLQETPRERLRLRIACRSAQWPNAQGEALLNLWGESDAPRIYELCPLRRSDAVQMADQLGLDGSRFMELVQERHVQSFAARPVTLSFLLKEFADKKTLPGTHREIYERGCRQLCAEHDPVRAEVLRTLGAGRRISSVDERLSAARRLAALLMLSGKAAVYAPLTELEPAEPKDLPIATAVTGFALDENAIRDALETGLFISAGPQRFAFAHQTYMECMASQALAALPLSQLRILLCARDNGEQHVVPQLAELAAWIAGESGEFRTFVLQREPEVLLRSDVTRWRAEDKEALVTALLAKAGREELFEQDAFWPFYPGLRHGHFADQIGNVIRDSTANENARRMALTMARAARDPDLTDDLLALTCDNSQPAWIRHDAVFALEECIPDNRLVELEPLARGEVGADPDQSIRGCALRRLVPKHWTVSDAMAYIQPEPTSRIISSYHTVLSSDLPRYVTKADLPAVLAATTVLPGHRVRPHSLAPLADAAFEIGLSHLGDPDIARLIIDNLRGWQRRDRGPIGDPNSRTRKRLDSDLITRRALVKVLLLDPATSENDLFRACFEVSLLKGADDLRWLLEELTAVPADRAIIWCRAIGMLASPEKLAPHWDFFLAQLATSPPLQAQFSWLREWKIEEPIARDARARALREKRWQRRAVSNVHRVPEAAELIRVSLAGIRKGYIALFSDLCFGLSVEPGSSGYSMLPLDITEAPGWQAADPEVHREFATAARRFLLQCSDGSPAPGQINAQSMAGSVAVWHLRDQLSNDADLRSAVINRWMGALLRSTPSEKEDAFGLAYSISQGKAIEHLLREATEECERQKHTFVFRRTVCVWDAPLAAAAEGFIRRLTDPKSLENTLREIAQLDEHLARRLIHEIIERSRNAATGDCAKLLEAALAAGLVTDAGEFWAVATPLFRENEELTKRVLLHVCSSGEIRGRNMFAQKLKTDDLADLYLTLQHVFPRQEDPPFNGSAVPPRRSIIFVRDELPGHISARGTAEACAALLHLIDQLPDEAIWLRRLYREALRTKRRAAWDPPSPADVCQIIERRDVRLVRNDDELLDAVLESLERFQIQHTQRTLPAVERFWNHEGMGQRRQGFRPKDEEFLSDEIARWLRDDLGSNRNVIVGREVQPRRGKKTDITVEAAIPANGMHTTEESPPCIVIEVKGCWNAKVKTALESQLIDDYLKPHGLTHGVYLVGWFVCDRWDGPWRGSKNCLAATTYAEAVGYVDQLANPFDGRQRPFRISGVVLDLMLPP